VRDLLARARDARVVLSAGFDGRNAPRSAWVESIDDRGMRLRTANLEVAGRRQLHFSFDLGAASYLFALPAGRLRGEGERLEAPLPTAIYESERRDLYRVVSEPVAGPRIEIQGSDGASVPATLRDATYHGLGVALPEGFAARLAPPLRVRFLEGERRGQRLHASLRHREPDPERPGWMRLGLAISQVAPSAPLAVERRTELRPASRGRGSAAAKPRPRAGSASFEVVHYRNRSGERIAAIVDRVADEPGGTAVIIPPAWGRTKETLLPLAATLTRSFAAAGENLAVIRFDGTHRRGESHRDPRFAEDRDSYLGFRFSRAVEDIRSTFDFLDRTPRFAPEQIVLVTFSLGSVEGRRAAAQEAVARREGAGARLAGWVSVVGMADLQSGLRAVSGGIDFAYGYLRGVRFGDQELVGVTADLDATGQDALDHELVFFEDAKRDMAQIDVPVTWFHGRHDAWMDLSRVQELMAAGSGPRRRLIEVPTGHQMRTSQEALDTFGLIASEVGEMALGRTIEAEVPGLVTFARQQRAEHRRRPSESVDRRVFWRDYLLGRDGTLGIEFLTATSAYGGFMAAQIAALEIEAGDTILDLGSGTGDFTLQLAERPQAPECRVVAIDYVREALERGRSRVREENAAPLLHSLVGDLHHTAAVGLPLREGSFDGVLASLLVSYLEAPEELLAEIRRVLRPGGRLVVSSLRRDADISKLYADALAELPPDRVIARFGAERARNIQALQRQFLNDAARILDLEERGEFRFFDAAELVSLVRAAGFGSVSCESSLGEPPQALLVSARAR